MIGAKTKLVSFTFRDRTIAVFEKSMPMIELLRFSDEVSRNSGKECRPLSPELADRLLHSGIRSELLRSSPFGTGGLIAYEKAGSPLGRDVIFEDHSGIRMVMGSGIYRGERSVALFVPSVRSGDFERDGKDVFLSIDQSRIVPVPAFPDASGWHNTYRDTTVPSGEPAAEGHGRFLSRTVNAYVGLIARGYSFEGHGKGHVCADFAPWYHLGAVFDVS